jgi:hypothetical protein
MRRNKKGRETNERTCSLDTFGPKLTVRHDRSTSYEPGNLDAVLLRAGAQCSICGGSGNLIYRDPVKLLRSECVIGMGSVRSDTQKLIHVFQE